MIVNCYDTCGASQPSEDAAMQAGWTYLSIAGKWRCGACAGALYRASSTRGHSGSTPDTLDKHSRGALPKETASTITPPSVKG